MTDDAILPWQRSSGGVSTPPAAPEPAPVAPPPLHDPADRETDEERQLHQLQVIKGRIHRKLLERLNLSNLDRLDREQVAEAIRKVVHDLITQESVPLNFEERSELVGQVLDEIFGLGRWSR